MTVRLIASIALVRNGLRVAASEKVILLFGMAYNSLFIVLFASIWRYTPFTAKTDGALNFTNMVWYVTVTELVMFSSGQFMHQVRNDVLSQQLTGLMGRPLPYWRIKMLQLLGRGLLNSAALSAAIFSVAYVITGEWPFTLISGAALLAVTLMALFIAVPASFAIGILDAWGQYARPIYWIWQKCLFVLGGLMLPLSLYPIWMQKLAAMTPFPAMVNLPATMVFQPEASGFAWVFIRQLFWLAALMILAVFLHSAVRRHIGKAGD
jgi:ABC-2 type transport system permease protein